MVYPWTMSVRYKFVEVSAVTDESLERAVNDAVSQGWTFDAIHFVTRDNSPRPCMAFVSFVREVDDEVGDDAP